MANGYYNNSNGNTNCNILLAIVVLRHLIASPLSVGELKIVEYLRGKAGKVIFSILATYQDDRFECHGDSPCF